MGPKDKNELENFESFLDEKWLDKEEKSSCQYCGLVIYAPQIDYCSSDCEKADSVWHRIN